MSVTRLAYRVAPAGSTRRAPLAISRLVRRRPSSRAPAPRASRDARSSRAPGTARRSVATVAGPASRRPSARQTLGARLDPDHLLLEHHEDTEADDRHHEPGRPARLAEPDAEPFDEAGPPPPSGSITNDQLAANCCGVAPRMAPDAARPAGVGSVGAPVAAARSAVDSLRPGLGLRRDERGVRPQDDRVPRVDLLDQEAAARMGRHDVADREGLPRVDDAVRAGAALVQAVIAVPPGLARSPSA